QPLQAPHIEWTARGQREPERDDHVAAVRRPLDDGLHPGPGLRSRLDLVALLEQPGCPVELVGLLLRDIVRAGSVLAAVPELLPVAVIHDPSPFASGGSGKEGIPQSASRARCNDDGDPSGARVLKVARCAPPNSTLCGAPGDRDAKPIDGEA